jgi:hypothetical protein
MPPPLVPVPGDDVPPGLLPGDDVLPPGAGMLPPGEGVVPLGEGVVPVPPGDDGLVVSLGAGVVVSAGLAPLVPPVPVVPVGLGLVVPPGWAGIGLVVEPPVSEPVPGAEVPGAPLPEPACAITAPGCGAAFGPAAGVAVIVSARMTVLSIFPS